MRVDDDIRARDLWVAARAGWAVDVEGILAPTPRGGDIGLSFYDVFADPGEHAAWDAWRTERARGARGQAA